MRHALMSLAGALVLMAGLAACEETTSTSFNYARPSAPQPVAAGAGATVLGVAGGLRMLRVEDATGTTGCDGWPEPKLRVLGAGGGQVGGPGMPLSAGTNTLLVREIGEHARVVMASLCHDEVEHVWTATTTSGGLIDVRAVPAPVGAPLRITGWSRDGQRLLGVDLGPDGTGRRLIAIDVGTGAVTDLGGEGIWVDELTGGGLVVDQGDQVKVGPVSVTFEDGGLVGARGRLALSPDGTRVAIGTGAGLIVATPDGRAPRWATEPILGTPAWSTDGVALAYVTPAAAGDGPGTATGGPVRIVTAASAPLTVSPTGLAISLAFSNDGPSAALVLASPAQGGVAEVGFPRWPTPVPATPDAYGRATIEAWVGGDAALLGRFTAESAAAALAARPAPDPAARWPELECHAVVAQSYCMTTVEEHRVVLRIDDALVAERAEHAVLDVFIDVPSS